MATRFVFTPGSVEFPTTNYPEVRLVNQRPVVAFAGDTANETCYWSAVIPQGWTGTKTAVIKYFMASATSGTLDIDVAVEAITPGDAVAMHSTDSFDTINSTNSTTVPGTLGYEGEISVTLTNNDSSAAGDYVRFSLTRDQANDTAAGDMYVLSVEIRDGA